MARDEIHWQKSSYSAGGDGGQCIELAATGDDVLMRESDDPGSILTASREKLRYFVLGVKSGEFGHLM
jgi:Domain of unknown function (DUF397)